MKIQVMSIIKHCRQFLKANHRDSRLSLSLNRIAYCRYLGNHICLTRRTEVSMLPAPEQEM